jgi:hypothetical protein
MKKPLDLRFRQVHLDFHTSPDIPDVGSQFDPDAFAETLQAARVNSISCFARCHHGMMYYDSKIHPHLVHPGLSDRTLLKRQMEACHSHGIRMPVYTTVQWDDHTAKHHPEWLCVGEKGEEVNWYNLYDPGFYRFLCVNSPYRDFLKAHVTDIFDVLGPVDGLFFDILFLTDCSCHYCRAGMEAAGLDPVKKEHRMQFAQETLDEFMSDMSAHVRLFSQDCSIFYNSSHIGPVIRPRLQAHSHLELESLPSGGWGYMHFPCTVRYARTLGLDCLGMTGKFHTSWGDFHSFKNKEALEFECFHMLTLNAKCMVGDQMEPGGMLSKPVYELIGSVYKQVEEKEPWCEQAEAVVDIGLLTPEEFGGVGHAEPHSAVMGATQMLMEAGHQFDVIDSRSDFSACRLLILPDNIPVSDDLRDKLDRFTAGGGSLIATFQSGMDESHTCFRLDLGVSLMENQTLDIHGVPVAGREFERDAYADFLLPGESIGSGLPLTEHVMYRKGMEVEAMPGSEVLAEAVQPFFNRTYKQFCSHRQAPSSGLRGYDGIVQAGRRIYFAHPIFNQYRQNAPKWCKTMMLNAINRLLPEPALRHDGPSTLITTVNNQPGHERNVVHLLHYVPVRKSVSIDVIEDVIPLYNVRVSLRADLCRAEGGAVPIVRLAPEMTEIPSGWDGGRLAFTVPVVMGHQMVQVQCVPG